MGSQVRNMKGLGAKTTKGGRRYSAISSTGGGPAVGVNGFKGKSLCIVFYPRQDVFTIGVKAFAEAQEQFNEQDCVVLACTADSSWSTWSTSLGLTLRGEMAAASLSKLKEDNFAPDPTSYDLQVVSLIMLDDMQCIRHVVSTSLEPKDAVESALEAAKVLRTTRLPDPSSLRRTMSDRRFEKTRFNAFKRRSFYDMELNTEEGQITLLGDSELSAQCHVSSALDQLLKVH